MVYFTEKLINEVRERSCIWDTSDVNHLNKNVLSGAWTEIAASLYSDWPGLSALDRRDRVTDVKKKWTNIKDSFVKEVKGNKPRKSPYQGPPEHRKKYYLFDHLQFLMPFVQDSTNKAAGPGPRKKARKNEGGETSSRREAARPADEVNGPQDAQRHEDALNDADALNNAAGRSAADTLCRLDGDLSFFVSLLPTVKSLNERQKINFKIGVLQLLARIKFDEAMQLQQQQQPPPPPFVAPDFGACFPVVQPYQQQPDVGTFPFVDRRRQSGAVSSTQQRHQQQEHEDRGRSQPAMKRETTDSSSSSSSVVDDDLDE